MKLKKPVLLSVLVLAEFVVILAGATFTSARGGFTPEAIQAAGGSTKVFSDALFNQMLLPFEVASEGKQRSEEHTSELQSQR